MFDTETATYYGLNHRIHSSISMLQAENGKKNQVCDVCYRQTIET